MLLPNFSILLLLVQAVMRAVEQDRVLPTGLGVCSEGSFQEETPLDLHFFPPLTDKCFWSAGSDHRLQPAETRLHHHTVDGECRAQTGGRTEKKQLG